MYDMEFTPSIGMRVKYECGFGICERCTIYDIRSLPVPKDKGNLDEGFINTMHMVLRADEESANNIQYIDGTMIYKIVHMEDNNVVPIDDDDDIFDNIPDTVLTPEELAEMSAP